MSRPTGPPHPDEHLVELTWVGAIEGEVLAARLRDAGIPVLVADISNTSNRGALRFTEGTRLYVREADAAAARALIALHDDGTLSDADLAAQAEAAAGTDFGDGAVV